MAIPEPTVRVFEDLGALCQAASAEFTETSRIAVSLRGRFLVALSGGRAPSGLYRLLGRAHYRERLAWGSLHVFWGDERCVRPEDPESNFRQAWEAFLNEAPIPPENVHRIRGEIEPWDAANEYALLLKEYASAPLDWPRFDLMLLGVGEDGHTASLFPGSAMAPGRAVLAAKGQYAARPAQRVTLTPQVFNSARKVMFLASGASKAEIVANVLQGRQQPELIPAQRIRPTDGLVIWLLDRAAAGGLTGVWKRE